MKTFLDKRKLSEKDIAHMFSDFGGMYGNCPIDDLVPGGLSSHARAFRILSYEARITREIGNLNC